MKYLVAATMLALAGCSASENPAPTAETSDSITSQTPTHSYIEEKDGIYYYVLDVSENDKANGRASGEINAFRYLGKDASGEHKVGLVESNGTISTTATCADPCRIISDSEGGKYQYDPRSLIGSVFADVISGQLKPSK